MSIIRWFTVYASVYSIKQEKIKIHGKIMKNVKIHFNYLPFKLNDRKLPNNFHEILRKTQNTRF